MKNIAIGILSIWLLAACDPVVDNKEMGGIVSESELKLDVHAASSHIDKIPIAIFFISENFKIINSYYSHFPSPDFVPIYRQTSQSVS